MTTTHRETVEIEGTEFHRYVDFGSSELILLRGSCDKAVGDTNEDGEHYERPCKNGGSVRTIFGTQDTRDRCGLHLTSRMENALDGDDPAGKTVLNLDQKCDKMVNPRPDAKFSISEACDDGAFVRVVHSDGSSKDFCRKHARDSWLNSLVADSDDEDQ